MKRPFWRVLWLPVIMFAAGAAAGTKAGIKYAKSHYVSKDRKFIEGKVTKNDE